MSGISLMEIVYFAFLLIPLALLIIGIVFVAITVSVVFIQTKLLHHHH